jgi:signal transduction histidine kinase
MGTSSSSNSALSSASIPVEHVHALLYRLDRGFIVTSREGQSLILNERAKKVLMQLGLDGNDSPNILLDVMKLDPKEVSRRIERGESEIKCDGVFGGKQFQARLCWIPESDWLAIELDETAPSNGGSQPTVQELLQEREITYRNLLAAYLKLQEVNRQKTVFLASAAHELKTPLAVIKGYYDLLLTGSLGKLSEKQRDILEESKESCERLVRLVSMFLNYSALESGKLVLQLRNANGSLHSGIQIRLSKSTTSSIQSPGQCLETHAIWRDCCSKSEAAFLGTACCGRSAGRRTAAFPASAAE